MSIHSDLPSRNFSGLGQGRSLGLKLVAVCGLVMLMAIPLMFISFISFERSNRADEVTAEVSERYGGEQYVSGPMIVAPYIQKSPEGHVTESGHYAVFAENGTADFSGLTTQIRKRSLFKVPTYSGEGTLTGQFASVTSLDTGGAKILWDKAQIVVALSDVRGLKKDVLLTLPNGSTRKFEPANTDSAPNYKNVAVEAAIETTAMSWEERQDLRHAKIAAQNYQRHGWLRDYKTQSYLSVPAGDLVTSNKNFTLKVGVALSGARRLGVTPFAQSTDLLMSADWGDPGFEGGFPPSEREIMEKGFSAEWSVPYLRRGIRAHGKAHQLPALSGSEKLMIVQFVSTDDPYQTVNRALKYAVLFIGMVFLSYFLFEVIVGVPVHVAQYLLIGLAQSIFYLLLLAFSEHIGFTLAFIVASGATITATAGYAGAVFGHKKYILRAGLVFALVYGLLYTLMRMQDFALMIGALASFIAIAGTMYLTRNIDWYGKNKAALPVE